MKIGIIGAENSHSEAIAKAINADRLVPGCSVDYLWGETPELAGKTAKNGNIPNVVDDSLEMLGKADAIIVAHRHPRHHIPAALPFIKAGIPVFIDKPLCYRSEEGIRFLQLAKKFRAPVTSFSVLPKQESYKIFLNRLGTTGGIKSGTLSGPCDIESPYGGIFFYGIHQVELALKAFGYGVCAVQAVRRNKDGTAFMFYANGLKVTINLIHEGCPGFSITADGEKETIRQELVYDSNIYLSGIRALTDMFRSHAEPESHENLLKPVKILEAMEQSLNDNGRIIPISRLDTEL